MANNVGFENLKDSAQSPAGHIVQVQSVGKYKEVLKSLLGPASYLTGGVTVKAEELELTWINYVFVSVALSADRRCYVIYPDNAGPCKTVKLVFTDFAGTEVANASDQSTKKFRLVAQGTY